MQHAGFPNDYDERHQIAPIELRKSYISRSLAPTKGSAWTSACAALCTPAEAKLLGRMDMKQAFPSGLATLLQMEACRFGLLTGSRAPYILTLMHCTTMPPSAKTPWRGCRTSLLTRSAHDQPNGTICPEVWGWIELASSNTLVAGY